MTWQAGGQESGPRGRPLVALVIVIAGWAMLRAGGWIAVGVPQAALPVAVGSAERNDRDADAVQPVLTLSEPARPAVAPLLALNGVAVARPARLPLSARSDDGAPASPPVRPMPGASAMAPPPQVPPAPDVRATAHRSLPATHPVALPRLRRWSADGWVMLRRGGTGKPLAAVLPSYGRSQAGAVLRYRLQPGTAHDPQAYLRLSAALSGMREQELAGGVALRPLPHIPVRAGAELRVTHTAGGTRLRPALLAVTEIPPVPLPMGLRAETYVQGGYVGGAFATPFADGQLRVDRPLPLGPRTTLDLGLGAWGGVQKGAGRLDFGPAIALSAPLGTGRVRVAADYRWRLAGDAQPGSGPAITISSGF